MQKLGIFWKGKRAGRLMKGAERKGAELGSRPRIRVEMTHALDLGAQK